MEHGKVRGVGCFLTLTKAPTRSETPPNEKVKKDRVGREREKIKVSNRVENVIGLKIWRWRRQRIPVGWRCKKKKKSECYYSRLGHDNRHGPSPRSRCRWRGGEMGRERRTEGRINVYFKHLYIPEGGDITDEELRVPLNRKSACWKIAIVRILK